MAGREKNPARMWRYRSCARRSVVRPPPAQLRLGSRSRIVSAPSHRIRAAAGLHRTRPHERVPAASDRWPRPPDRHKERGRPLPCHGRHAARDRQCPSVRRTPMLLPTPVQRADEHRRCQCRVCRWRVVERTFAWLGRCRRLAKDWERSIESSTALANIASIRMLTRKSQNSQLIEKLLNRGLRQGFSGQCRPRANSRQH